MRIVGGKLRGKQLDVPEGKTTRPTLDRVRETVFNIMEHNSTLLQEDGRSRLHDAVVLDAFAGSGALGIEALSRGAKSAVFFETDRAALSCLKRNVAGLAATVKAGSVLTPGSTSAPSDIVFFDPPFKQDLLVPAIEALSEAGWITKDTLLYWESDVKERVPDAIAKGILLERRIGKVTVRFLTL